MKKGMVILICLLTLLLSGAVGAVLGGFCGYYAAEMNLPVCEQERQKSANEDQQERPQTDKDQQSNTVADIAKFCTKSVVNITVKEKSKGYTGGSAVSETVLGHGTGVIIREDGYIVTCHHVIEGADVITVNLDDKTEYDAKLIGHDERFDLAVIKVDVLDLPAASLGDSDAISSGEGVVVIGNPLGEFGSSVSSGVLSAPTRDITIAGTPLRLMQTDAAVNPGNSGGGLFNMRGQLIGIVNAKISASGIEGIGFAIPLNTIREKVESIISSGTTGQKAVLGVSTKTATCYIDGVQRDCLEVASVRSGGAAEEGGLKAGDYLLSADEKRLENNDDLTLAVKYCAPGDQVDFEVYRDKEIITITVTLGSD